MTLNLKKLCVGANKVLDLYERQEFIRDKYNNIKFKIFPSLRFEYFLKLLQNSSFMIGNSSAGIREAPYYNVPTVDIGTRQNNRMVLPSIFHASCDKYSILTTIEKAISYEHYEIKDKHYFGEGKSDKLFIDLLDSNKLWKTSCQKQFQEL